MQEFNPKYSDRMTPMRAIALLSTLQSADIVLPATAGRKIRVRRISISLPAIFSSIAIVALGSYGWA